MPSRARLGVVARLALLLLRESYYQMNKYQSASRTRRLTAKRVLVSSLISSILVNVMGLTLTAVLLTPPELLGATGVEYELGTRLLSLQALILLLSLFMIFSGSWMVQIHGIIDPIAHLPLSDTELNLSYTLASGFSVLWVLVACPISALVVALRTGSAAAGLAAALSALAGLSLGSSAGFLLSALVGGKRHTGPSKRAVIFQLVNTTVFFVAFFLSYQVYALAQGVMELARMVAEAKGILPAAITALYPFHTLLAFRSPETSLILSSLWLAVGATVYRRSFSRFWRTIVSPTYIRMGGASGARILPPRLVRGYKLALALKDLRSIFRDIRLAPLFLFPFLYVVYITMNTGGNMAAPGIPLSSLLLTLAFFTPLSCLQLARTDERYAWLLFSHGLNRKMLVKGKLALSAIVASIYLTFAVGVMATVASLSGQVEDFLKLLPSLGAGLAFIAASSLASTAIVLSMMASRMSLEGYGLELDIRHSVITIMLGTVGAGVSVGATLSLLTGWNRHVIVPASAMIVTICSAAGYLSIARLPTD